MYQCCLKRRKSSALDVESEDLEIGILSEPEWIFVFERVGAIGRKVKSEQLRAKIADESICNVSPEAEFVLDLRYIARSIRAL